jgi:2-oxoglutarate dehydrogenase E2 component (dihydrolipoamide succinyltransferase)
MLPINVPPLGESIVEATISRWVRKEGDRVEAGETLVELETDKVTVEVPSLKAGVLVRRTKNEGDVVTVGDLLGEVDETAIGAATSQARPSGISTVGPAPLTPPAPTNAASPGPVTEVKSSPAARRLAADEGVDLAALTGTGRGGVVSKPDVVEHMATARTAILATPASATPQAAAAPSPAPAPAASSSVAASARETREKMSTRRRRIAEHLLEAQHATAHLTTFNEIDMTAVDALRARVRERVEKEHGVKLSYMPFFVKAACLALRQYPTVNARLDGDDVVYHHYVHMGIAVASDAGLVVPNVKDADRMGMVDIARGITAVATKARDGKLAMDDLTGGTFTITNGGVFGSLVSTPIINYPQVGILGLHKIQARPVAERGEVVIRPMMYVALSYDHRIIDGQQAVLFLVKVKELMEDPATMVID